MSDVTLQGPNPSEVWDFPEFVGKVPATGSDARST
jgi:hypothetical protein